MTSSGARPAQLERRSNSIVGVCLCVCVVWTATNQTTRRHTRAQRVHWCTGTLTHTLTLTHRDHSTQADHSTQLPTHNHTTTQPHTHHSMSANYWWHTMPVAKSKHIRQQAIQTIFRALHDFAGAKNKLLSLKKQPCLTREQLEKKAKDDAMVKEKALLRDSSSPEQYTRNVRQYYSKVTEGALKRATPKEQWPPQAA